MEQARCRCSRNWQPAHGLDSALMRLRWLLSRAGHLFLQHLPLLYWWGRVDGGHSCCRDTVLSLKEQNLSQLQLVQCFIFSLASEQHHGVRAKPIPFAGCGLQPGCSMFPLLNGSHWELLPSWIVTLFPTPPHPLQYFWSWLCTLPYA